MSQADILLANLSETVVKHEHAVIDSDSYFVIDHITRQIDNLAHSKNTIMQYDHNSERFTFEVARYVEGHDMSLCNRVRVHYINVDGKTGESYADLVELDDLQVDPNNSEVVICSWLISRHATQLAGTLNFLVQYMCVSDGGVVDYEWHSDIYYDINVNDGRNNGEPAIIEYTDLVEQWRAKLFGTGNSAVAEITLNAETQLSNLRAEGAFQVDAVTSEGETQVDAVNGAGAIQIDYIETLGDETLHSIRLKGEETLATIPEDYTTTYNMAEEALRRKADAIALDAEGEMISVDDASDGYLLGMKLYGKTTQKTTTGKNLFDVSKIVSNGRVVNDGGVITVITPEGSSAVDSMVNLGAAAPHLEAGKKYTFTFETTGTGKYIYLEEAKFMWGNGYTYEVTQEMLDSDILFYASGVSTTATITNIMFRDASITDGTYEPYTGGVASPNPDWPQDLVGVENPTVYITGKNLFDMSKFTMTSPGEDGAAPYISKVEQDRIVITTSSGYTGNGYCNSRVILKKFCPSMQVGRTYVMSGNTDRHSFLLHLLRSDVTWSNGQALTVTQEMLDADVVVYGLSTELGDPTGDCVISNIQIEEGAVVTEYETYKGCQVLTIPRTLHGIPVTSGGNYTDSNGQQWICDEIDFERGVYVQRLTTKTFDGTEYFHIVSTVDGGLRVVTDWEGIAYPNDALICSHLKTQRLVPGITQGSNAQPSYYVPFDSLEDWKSYLAEQNANGTPMIAIGLRSEPIETPLTEVEIAEYKKLHTNYHNTTVVNNRGANMAIKYAADTLIYLRDNQPKPTDEQIENAVNEYAAENGIQVPSDEHIAEIAKQEGGSIKTVNGVSPDSNGNVTIEAITDAEITELLAALEEEV